MKPSKKTPVAGKLAKSIEDLKKKLVVQAVQRQGSLQAAAKELGISRSQAYNILVRHGYRIKAKVVRTVELQGPK